ncbi:MAG: hypothetical protein U0271_43990 [Polyangiaceae bacterium]
MRVRSSSVSQRTRRPVRWLGVALASAAVPLGLAVFLPGCEGKKMTQADCERVGKHMREIWDDEVAATAPSEDRERSERAKNAIRIEGERITNDWLAQCRRDIEGRRVDQKEIDCILSAKTIAALESCAAKK